MHQHTHTYAPTQACTYENSTLPTSVVMKMNDSDHGSWACRNGASAGLSVVNRTPVTSEHKWEVFKFLYTCLHWVVKDMKVPCFNIRKWLVGFHWDPFLLVVPIPSHCCNPKFHFLVSFNIYQSCKIRVWLADEAVSVSRAKARDTAPCCCLRGSFQRLWLWWRQDSWLCCRKNISWVSLKFIRKRWEYRLIMGTQRKDKTHLSAGFELLKRESHFCVFTIAIYMVLVVSEVVQFSRIAKELPWDAKVVPGVYWMIALYSQVRSKEWRRHVATWLPSPLLQSRILVREWCHPQ